MMVSYRGRNIPFSPVKTVLTMLFILGGMGVLGVAFTSDKGAADFFDVGGYFAEDAEPVYLADKDGDKKSKESDEDKAKRLKGQAKDWLKYRGEDRYEGWVRTKADKKKLEKIDKDIEKHVDKKSLTGEKADNYRDQTRKDELTKLKNSKVSISWYAWLVIFFALAAAGFALFTARKFFAEVKAKEPGNKEMVEIADAVTDGAMAYLNRQKKIVSPTLLGVAVVISLIVGLLGADAWWLSIFVFFGIMSGGALSFLAGWIGMKTATMASSRTAWACKEDGLDGGLQVAFKAGAVMGLLVVGLGLAFVSTWALVMFGIVDLASDITMKEAANAMITFGLGASLVALFARVGGGIFTKAADVGADLVGKVEAGIPEDDPRNPATIADNVGDNVGDVAGMGADLYESYVGSILASIALSWSAATALGRDPWAFMAAPLLIAAGGILLSIYSTRLVKAKEGANLKELLHSLHKGVNFASIGSAGVALVVCLVLFGWAGLGFFGA
ncbi:MAG: sodium/proton-translocating pyrophosphatase, partial [Planctomycetes bacterium]|nr:sodium/proton-translocating pyrophosphatase [Planctomycetota bacterium]